MSTPEEYERAPKRMKVSAEDEEELEEGEESDSASAGLLGDDEEDEGQSRARWSSAERKDSGSETHRIAPSPVVHVRGLCESVVEADLVEALEKFGNICEVLLLSCSYVMMMPFKRQALVEFEEVQSADRCVACGSQEPVYIAGQQAYFNYSTSKRITRPTNADDPNSGNKVLLLSIQNPLYPITTDVLYTVCNPIGNVLRIVIFKRNGIQAMPSRLNVIRNDNDSWDYTKPFLLRRGDPQEFSVKFNDQLCLMLSNASEELRTDPDESQSEFRSALVKL
ncbi:hypothetical protein cypCar_00040708 [Cyprinus carpio]|nr:hypothetical protein cypCar_00040708 [Cyprinus carpio]